MTTSDLETLSASLGFSLDEMQERLESGEEDAQAVINDTRAQLAASIEKTKAEVEAKAADQIEQTGEALRQDGLWGVVGLLVAGVGAYARRNATRRQQLGSERSRYEPPREMQG